MEEEVRPKCDAMEEKWWEEQQLQCHVSAAHLRNSELPIKSIQLWCQVRLQGFFSHAPFNARVRCLLCSQIAPACWEHWQEGCSGARKIFQAQQWPEAAGSRQQIMCQPGTYEQALWGVALVSALHKSLWSAFYAADGKHQ